MLTRGFPAAHAARDACEKGASVDEVPLLRCPSCAARRTLTEGMKALKGARPTKVNVPLDILTRAPFHQQSSSCRQRVPPLKNRTPLMARVSFGDHFSQPRTGKKESLTLATQMAPDVHFGDRSWR